MGGSHERIAKWLATPAGVAAKKALPTFRLWCIVEIAAAIFRHLAVVVKGGCVRGKDGGNIFVYDLEGADMMMQNAAWWQVALVRRVGMVRLVGALLLLAMPINLIPMVMPRMDVKQAAPLEPPEPAPPEPAPLELARALELERALEQAPEPALPALEPRALDQAPLLPHHQGGKL